MSRLTRRLGPIVLVILGLTFPSRADWLELQDGRTIELPAEVHGEEVVLTTPDGPITFPVSDFRRIIHGPNPEREWTAIHRPRALAAKPLDRSEAARWALGHGLTAEALAMLRAAAQTEPDQSDGPAARMVSRLDRLAIPLPDPDLGAIRLPGRFQVARGPHVIFFHQQSEADANERVELLERIITTFDLTWTAEGFDLQLPEARLISIWFARRADYWAYLQAVGAVDFQATHGFYLPDRGLVVAYDARSDEDQRHGRARIERQEREVARAERELEALPEGSRYRLVITGEPPRTVERATARMALESIRRRIKLDRLWLDLNWRRLDLGTAAHEMVHQLIAATGLAPRRGAFPEWLHEGLAMQFEVIRGGRWAGPSAVNNHRLGLDRRARSPARLAPLIRDRGFGHGYDADAYARAWTLVNYLRHERPDAFRDFLGRLRQPAPGRSDRAVSAFRAAFGPDLEALEAAWRRHADGMPGPTQWD